MSREMFSGNLRNRLHSDEWLIWQDQYEAKENLKYESLFALSNGYLGIRGSHEEGTKITLPSMECLTSQRHLCVNFPHFRTGLESDFM